MAYLSIILLIALVIFIKLKLPAWKGRNSEKLVNSKLSRLPAEYKTLDNLLFISNGRSAQIDQLVISPYGLFVIETKGYKGWITGSEDEEYWTQSIYKNKYSFYNPVKQNDGHVRFLRHLLSERRDIPYFPIVVFNDEATLRVRSIDHIVINRRDLNDIILRYRTPVLSPKTVDWIVKTVRQNATVPDGANMRRHRKNARTSARKTSTLIRKRICPECGGTLLLRQGPYGSFYGCSNYPSCRFTVK